jgi:hypothetical protein
MLEMKYAYKTLLGKSEGRRLLGRPRHRWNDNIKVGLSKNMVEGVDPCYMGPLSSWHGMAWHVLRLWMEEKVSRYER